MNTKDSIPTGIKCSVVIMLAIILVFSTFAFTAFAAPAKTEVPGQVYEFGKDSHYEFSDSKDFVSSENADTYGTVSINGEVSDVTTKNGVPAYEVTGGNLKFFYNYGDILLNADEDSWHLIEDKSKRLDDLKLSENILKGAIILQTSMSCNFRQVCRVCKIKGNAGPGRGRDCRTIFRRISESSRV